MEELKFDLVKIKPITERLNEAQKDRLEYAQGSFPFGVNFFDESTLGIGKKDLILLGSRSGSGKTELVTIMAQSAARSGKKVAMFALEAEENEIRDRILYREISGIYFKDSITQKHSKSKLSYVNWYYGKCDDYIYPFEERAKIEIKKWGENLCVFYRNKETTIQDIEREIIQIPDDVSLIIIDHLNYIDFDEKDYKSTENLVYSNIVKKLHDLALYVGKPIILVAHLRKRDKFSSVIPEMEDFQGTSNIFKNATKVITFGSLLNDSNMTKYLKPTYFRIEKFRKNKSVDAYAARLMYDIRTNSYQDKYLLGQIWGKEFRDICKSQCPDWSNNNCNQIKQEVEKDEMSA